MASCNVNKFLTLFNVCLTTLVIVLVCYVLFVVLDDKKEETTPATPKHVVPIDDFPTTLLYNDKYVIRTPFTVNEQLSFVLNLNDYNYIADRESGNLNLYDNSWKLRFQRTFPYMTYVTLGDHQSLFISSIGALYKTDLFGNVQRTHKSPSSDYQSIHYDAKRSRLYVAVLNDRSIHIFNQDLVFLRTITLPAYTVLRLTGHNGELYVAGDRQIIVMNENGDIQRKFKTICSIDTIGFNSQSRLMALACSGDNKVYLYDSNGAFSRNSIQFDEQITHLTFNLKNQLIVSSIQAFYIIQ